MWLKTFLGSTGLYLLIILTVIHCTNARRITRDIKDGSCGGWNAFRCLPDECIESNRVCDGKPDCTNGADETAEICYGWNCRSLTDFWRCNYGACVKAKAKCDGIKDCYDGSDEQGCTRSKQQIHPIPPQTVPTTTSTTSTSPPSTTTSRPPIPVNCLRPNNPANGEYSIGGQNSYRPGAVVPQFKVLITKCDYGYKTSPDNLFSVCANGIWIPIPSKCL